MNTLPSATGLLRPLVADGAMGTMLFRHGLPIGEAPEAWILTPEGAAAVTDVHRGHAGGGAQILLTCTFGANSLRLYTSDVPGRTAEICRAAVAAAKAAAGTDTLVAASMGPTGGLLIPYGLLDEGAVRASYAEQAAACAEAGVDLLWIETMMDVNEAAAAVDGARQGAPGLPVIATMTFTPQGRTMFGNKPGVVAATLAEHGAAGVGANCGEGFAPVEMVMAAMRDAAPGLHLVAKANAGLPVTDADGNAVYPAAPEEAATYARTVADLGATIIGGCCGTTPDHVAAMAAVLAGR